MWFWQLQIYIFSKNFGYFPIGTARKLVAMVEIDNIQRVSLRAFKPFFTEVKRLRRAVEKVIESNPEKEAEALRLFSSGASSLKGSFTLSDGRIMDITAHVNTEAMEISCFFFRWIGSDGKEKLVSVNVEKRPSNLGIDEVYYFICPHTKKLCRKLFTDGYTITSRWAFPHTYSKRNLSKYSRVLFGMVDAMVETDKDYRYRKERYRGKLTPFGKRMYNNYLKICAFVGRDGKIEPSARADFESTALIAPRRGRPRQL